MALNPSDWFGPGDDYQLTTSIGGATENPNYLANWDTYLSDLRFSKWGFRIIRVDFSFAKLGANPLGWYDHTKLDYAKYCNVVKKIGRLGYQVIASDHSWANFGSALWVQEWVDFVTYLKNNDPEALSYIAAFELRNEASVFSWEPTVWIDGLTVPTFSDNPPETQPSQPGGVPWWERVTNAYAACTDAVRAVLPGAVVTWADPGAYYRIPYTGGYIPPRNIRPNVVYAWHGWISFNNPTSAVNAVNYKIGKMTEWQNTYGPVWMGETGSWTGTNNCDTGVCTAEGQAAAGQRWLEWGLANGVGVLLFFWHHWNRQDEYNAWLAAVDFPQDPPTPPDMPNMLVMALSWPVPVYGTVASFNITYLDSFNQPIVGASVTLMNMDTSPPTPIHTVTTDAEGHCTIRVLEDVEGEHFYQATTAQNISNMINLTVPAMPEVYTCSYCGLQFLTQADLDYHISLMHPQPQNYTVTITANTGGQTNPEPGSYSLAENKPFTVHAVPDPTYEFSGWFAAGTLVSSLLSYSFTVTGNVDLAAQFTEKTQPPQPGPCFIATAAYGSSLAPELNTFRHFRDRCMPAGLVNFYYNVGPYGARIIARFKTARAYARQALNLVLKALKGGKRCLD